MTTIDQRTILMVDDSSEILAILSNILHPQYRVLAAPSASFGLRVACSSPKPDLILLDVMMPDMDGYTVLSRLMGNPASRDIPVIFLTSLAQTDEEEKGLLHGAVDYITKPINSTVLLARVRTQLEAKQARDILKNQNSFLEAEVAKRMEENNLTQQVSIRALAHLAETRDPETGDHIRRTQGYVRLLAVGLQNRPRFADTLNDNYIDLLARSAPLHDIGKVGIPDHVLLKPGKLTAEEMIIMQRHAKLGSDSIELAEREIEKPLKFLSLAKEIAHWHHEKWDGSGYPDGLAGDDIPVSARLMALADVFDALISKRIYKPAMPYVQARDIIVAERGKHFDPEVVDVFNKSFDEFVAIAKKYQDHDAAFIQKVRHSLQPV